MNKFHLALAFSLAAVPAYAQTQGTGTSAATSRNSAAAQDFVNKATMGDMYEIQSSKMALDKSQASEIQNFAQKIVDDHTKSSNELKSLTKGMQGVQVPSQLDAKHKDMIDKLQSASSDQFNRLYRSQQIDAHNQAIQLYQNFSSDNGQTELGQFAQRTLPTLKQHLQMAQNLPQQPATVGQAPAAAGSQRTAQSTNQGSRNTAQGQSGGQQQVLAQPGPDHILGSDLRGTTVYGANGENVGDINEILLDRDGRVVALVVGVGGFLGIGEKDVAIPFDALEIQESRDAPAQGGQASGRSQQMGQSGQSGQADRSTTANTRGTSTLQPNRVVLKGMTKQELEAAPNFESSTSNR